MSKSCKERSEMYGHLGFHASSRWNGECKGPAWRHWWNGEMSSLQTQGAVERTSLLRYAIVTGKWFPSQLSTVPRIPCIQVQACDQWKVSTSDVSPPHHSSPEAVHRPHPQLPSTGWRDDTEAPDTGGSTIQGKSHLLTGNCIQ